MSPLVSLVEIGPADTEVECFLSSSPPFWSCWHIDRSAFKPGQRQRRPCPFDSPCTPVPMATWGRACSCLQAACSFSISAWGVVSLHLSIHPSIQLNFLSLPPSKKENQWGLWGKKKKKNCSHNLSLLIVSCHTFQVRGTNALWCEVDFTQGDTADCSSLQQFWPALPLHLFAIMSVLKAFLFFLLVKHKTVCDNISFLEELLQEWIGCRHSTLVSVGKSWTHSLTAFVTSVCSDKWDDGPQK